MVEIQPIFFPIQRLLHRPHLTILCERESLWASYFKSYKSEARLLTTIFLSIQVWHKRCKIYLIWIEINHDGQECILVFVTTFVNVRITSQMRFPCQTDFDILFQAWIWAIRNLCFLVNQVRNCDSHIYMQ